MERIQLLTSIGQHVAWVEILQFPPGNEPKVVMWGSRIFVRGADATYVEAFAFTSLTPSPGLPEPVVVDRVEPVEVDRTAVMTLHGTPVEEIREIHAAQPVGQHADYIVLTQEERAKGFVRPVRRSYRHIGIPGPKNPLRDLTEEEIARHGQFGYVKFEEYPKGDSSVTGRYWTQKQLDSIGKGCNGVTTMGVSIAETYARDPSFYGSTMCVTCNVHLPVGENGEFVWEGTSERVGS